jgi:hypothetical protein
MRTRYFLFLLITVFVSGCANHLRFETLTVPKKVTSEPELEYFIIIDKEIINSSRTSLKLEQQETREVKDSQLLSDIEHYTPYQGTREFYEFPLGVVLLPVAVVVNLTDFALLGLLPNRMTNSVLDMSFAGMNPALNIESDSRSERNIIKTQEKIIHVGEDIKRVPARNTTITISSSNLNVEMKTDNKGNLVIDLLAKDFLDKISDLRELKLSAGSGNGEDTKKIIISRELSFKVKKAIAAYQAYWKVKTPDKLASTIYYMEKELKFEKLSAALEKKALKETDAKFKKDYKTKLQNLFK